MNKKYLMMMIMCLNIFNVSSLFAWNTHAPSSNVLIFVSFSMPKESLRGWLRQAELIKAPVIIRGLVHNSFRDTTKAVMDIIPNNRGGIQLDPLLFRQFHIEKVPAVVVTRADCAAQETCQEFDVIYGDVTLDYALKEVANQDDPFSSYAELALNRLKENKTSCK
jgi:conjugal transfer pilus assembly protein TrbC